MNLRKISIIIPAYNEESRIGRTLEEYCKYFREKKQNFEIVVVINNTQDKTPEICEAVQKKYKEIKILNFKQGGKGFAIIEGFKDSLKRKNDLIGFVDADMATPSEAFYDLIKNIGEFEGIIASRWLKGAQIKKQTLLRRFVSRGFNFIVRSSFLMNYRDTQCGAKLFNRNVIEEITPGLNLTKWAFDINLLYLCKRKKFKINEFPTIWEDKDGSKISSVPKTSFQMFSGVVRLRLIYSPFEKLLKPIKFILKIGDKLLN